MRVLLIEDHPIVRSACCRILQAKQGMEIIEAATGADGLQAIQQWDPDIVILDLNLPDQNGLALLSQLSGFAVIVFSMYDDPAFAARALEAGARGYMTKNDDPEALLEAIETVTAGEIFLTAPMTDKLATMPSVPANGSFTALSGRERQFLQLLGRGKTLAEIAGDLNVAYRTSAHIAARIKAKLRVPSTAALIKWAVEHPEAGAADNGVS